MKWSVWRTPVSTAFLVFTPLVVAAWLHVALAQDPPPPGPQPRPAGPEMSACWGERPAAEGVAHYELAAFVAGEDPNAAEIAPQAAVSVPSGEGLEACYPLSTLLPGAAAGVYALRVRAVDRAQNQSAWSGPLPITWDADVPGTPAGLRVVVTVTVEVGN